MKKAYKYGIELECFLNRDMAEQIQQSVRTQALPFAFGSDGSLGSTPPDYMACEIRCISGLSYTKLERGTKKLSKILQKNGTMVNRTCGYHLHMSNKRFFNKKFIIRLAHTWAALEDVLMSTQPKSRYSNQYCQRFLLQYIERDNKNLPTAKQDLAYALSESHMSRYYTLNLAALRKHGTIEVRLHSGTVDGEKILSWVRLIQAIYDYVLERYDINEISSVMNMTISDEKIQRVFALLQLSDKDKAHFTARIERFGFELLSRQQQSALKMLAMSPEKQKKQKKLDKAQNELNRVLREYNTFQRAFQASVDSF